MKTEAAEYWERALVEAATDGREVVIWCQDKAEAKMLRARMFAERARDAKRMAKLFTREEVGAKWGQSQWAELEVELRNEAGKVGVVVRKGHGSRVVEVRDGKD